MGKRQTRWLWALWITLSLVLVTVAAVGMAYGGPRQVLLIGKTSDAHHQIELACNGCHTTWFGGRESIETACLSCHAEDLEASKDNHPAKKFTDPRNADRLAKLDAAKCLTCHVEHRPEVTGPMAVTLQGDFCVACHAEVGEERPSHKGLAFTTCASAGCHNFHDNRALYEDFLEKHLADPSVRADARMSFAAWRPGRLAAAARPASAPDAPPSVTAEAHATSGWLASAHAVANVNCSGCHQPPGAAPGNTATWIAKPGRAQCATCHAPEVKGFTQGKHGMRLAQGMWTSRRGPFGLIPERTLGPMRPDLARLPMKAQAHGRELECATCHQAHDFDTREAKVEACVSCHDEEHTRAYLASPHYRLWQAELSGKAPEGSGVACATCHMPKAIHRDADGIERLVANHNQNDNLRPNEKMARGVCLDCHGLGFTLDALADRRLINRNFNGRPQTHVESLDWVARRVRQRGQTP